MTLTEKNELLRNTLTIGPNFKLNIKEKTSALRWDTDEILYTVTIEDLKRAISMFEIGQISESDIEDWANFIENREDINFDTEDTKEIIHDVANPVLTGENVVSRIKRAV